MKAEERHRLHEHELGRITERARPFFERHGATLLLGLAGVLVLIAVAVYVARTFGQEDPTAWNEMAAALRGGDRTAERLAGVAEDHADTPVAAWAKLLEADVLLRNGTASLYVDRDGAKRELEDARKAFQAVLDNSGSPDDVRVRAQYGLARTLETSSDGDLGPAIAAYEEVSKRYPETLFDRLAKERVAALKSGDAKAFYAWFSQQKVAPQDMLGPRDRGPVPDPPRPPGTAPNPGTTPNAAAPVTPGQPVEAPRPAEANAEAPAEPAAESSAPAEGETPPATPPTE